MSGTRAQRRTPRRPSRPVLVGLVGLGVAAVAVPVTLGLTGEEGSPASEKPGTSSTVDAVAVSSTLTGRQPALQHLRITACPSGEGEVEATGTVRNRGKEAADYVVTVIWLDGSGAVVEAVETSVEDVAPATNAEWSATATLAEPAGSCTTTAARGTLP